MRLGVLGPAQGSLDALERAAQFLHRDLGVQRAVYLGLDGSLDALVARWAERLVGDDPGSQALWERAAERCADAQPHEIDAFLVAERERQSLAVFESVPSEKTRLVELLGGRVVVMIHDKALLDEDDIASASLMVFGKSKEPMVKQVGTRFFLSPGPLGEFGILVLEDQDDGVHLALYDGVCREVRRERLLGPLESRLSVSGGGTR